MASLRSNRSSIASQSSLKSNGSGSEASSVPSHRSGYVEDADPDGTRSSFKTTRYERLGKLAYTRPLGDGRSILDVADYPEGGVFLSCGNSALAPGEKAVWDRVYYTGDSKGWVSKETMKRRTDAYAVDRAAKARKRAERHGRNSTKTTMLKRPSPAAATAGKMNTAPAKLEYFGYVVDYDNSPTLGLTATVITAAGQVQPTVLHHYKNTTLPAIGMLVYKPVGAQWRTNMVSKQDAQCLGCITHLGEIYRTVKLTDPTGRKINLRFDDFADPSTLKYGALVYKSSDGRQYIARDGK